MRTRRIAVVAAFACGTWALCAGATEAQQLPTVTVTSTREGTIGIDHACGGVSVGLTPPEIVLTRTGDLTGDLTVSIAWSGDIALATAVSPTSVTFAPGSSTTTVMPLFDPASALSATQQNGSALTLTLTVTRGSGYQPGDPSTATPSIGVVQGLAPPCAPPSPPPPVEVNPAFTG